MPNIERLESVNSGDWHRDSNARGVIIGELLEKKFPLVASVGAAAGLTTVQATLWGPNRPFRLRGVSAVPESITGAATFDVYNSAVAPATVLSAPKALGAANALTSGVVADESIVYAAGSYFTLRVTTVASTGALGNLHAGIEYEILPA